MPTTPHSLSTSGASRLLHHHREPASVGAAPSKIVEIIVNFILSFLKKRYFA